MDQLSPEEIEILKKAKAAKAQMESMGLMSPGTVFEKPVASNVNTGVAEEEKQYSTFMDIKELPSKGKFYTNPIKGQPLTVPDLILIQGMNNDNLFSRFTEIFSRRIRGVSPMDMLSVDEFYISLWLRASSFPNYSFPYVECKCKKCGLVTPSEKTDFYFDAIQVKTNIDEICKLYDGKMYIEDVLPVSKEKIKIYPRKRIHQARVEYILKEKYYDKEIKPPEDEEHLLDILSLVEIGSITDLRDVYKYVNSENFGPIDYIELIKKINKTAITEEVIVNITCSNPVCKEVASIPGYPFSPSIYIPIYSNTRDKIS